MESGNKFMDVKYLIIIPLAYVYDQPRSHFVADD